MKKLAMIMAMMTLPLAAQAQDAFYISGLLGMTSLDSGDNTGPEFDTELSYGLRAGLLFNDHVSAGIYLHRLVADADGGAQFFTKPATDLRYPYGRQRR